MKEVLAGPPGTEVSYALLLMTDRLAVHEVVPGEGKLCCHHAAGRQNHGHGEEDDEREVLVL